MNKAYRIFLFVLSLCILTTNCYGDNGGSDILTSNPDRFLGKWQAGDEVVSIAKRGSEFVFDIFSSESIFSFSDSALVGQNGEMLFYRKKDDCLFFSRHRLERVSGDSGDYIGQWRPVHRKRSYRRKIFDLSAYGETFIFKRTAGASRPDTLVNQDGVLESTKASTKEREFYALHRYQNREYLFLAFKLTRVSTESPKSTSSKDSGKLTRESAAAIIVEERGYPMSVQASIPVGRISRGKIGIFGPSWDDYMKAWSELESLGYLRLKDLGEIQETTTGLGIRWKTVEVTLINRGRTVFTKSVLNFYSTEICQAVFVGVTGISIQKEGALALVEYTWKYDRFSPIFHTLLPLASLKERNIESVHKEQIMMIKYDDGWRILR